MLMIGEVATHNSSEVAQLVVQLTCNEKVGSSNLFLGTNN